ncbi:hypothetical protein O2V63_01170 [Modestobacter sp. VKM Ac-2977]|uniref:DUF6779 domain-containing protein n=1 Tax=Modestobacter sp. VKM Ac-2977 TaxID=3004131 RepID=UPI0022AB2EA3|nr:DUF6779 domain-containing protein [Modestobacter sp. VKM Ac-2977]MCZ2818941.1 hypothetical protein [Modestobacter sp. VKM Ac-2977]
MTGRQGDITRGHLTAVAPAPRPTPRVWSAIALVLAVPATAAVFLTENPLHLRVALLAVCWAFVIAAFLAGSRRADQVAAAAREAELRHAYDVELAREVAARHEHEAQLENRLRREAEQAMRAELGQLRTELTALTELRGELTALPELRRSVAALSGLRAELAGLGELRSDLGRMRSELTEQLSGELLIERMVMRAQSVRGPGQPADAGRAVEGAPPAWESSGWVSSPAGWDPRSDVGRALPTAAAEPRDEPPSAPSSARQSVAVAAPSAPAEEPPSRDRTPSPLEWLVEEAVLERAVLEEAVLERAVLEEAVLDEAVPEPWVEPSPRSPLAWLEDEARLGAVGRPPAELPVVPMPSRPPLPEPALRVSDVVAAMSEPVEPPRRRHRRAAEPDEEGVAPDDGRRRSHAAPEERLVTSAGWSDGATAAVGPVPGTPVADLPPWASWEPPAEPAATDDAALRSWSDVPTADPTPRAAPPAQGHARLEQILAESGVSAPRGGRSRRRRYRDEGDDAGDDVLARVLGR